MKSLLRYAFVAAALSSAAVPTLAQDMKKGEAARPANSAANKPSESGAQSNMPTGAATGAGQPQGAAQPAQAQSPGSAKAKAEGASGPEATVKKPAKTSKKKRARKHSS